MSVRNLLTLNALFALLTAVILIFSPGSLAVIFDVEIDGVALQLTQLFGTASVGYGISSWLMRGAGPSDARTAFLLGGGAGYVVVGIVSGIAMLNGLGTPVAWAGNAGVFLLSALFLNFGIRSSNTV